MADQRVGLRERPDRLFDEERVASGRLDERALERGQSRIVTEKRVEKLGGDLRGERTETNFRVMRRLLPCVLIFGSIVDEEKDSSAGDALDETVEDGLRVRVDPVQVLH